MKFCCKRRENVFLPIKKDRVNSRKIKILVKQKKLFTAQFSIAEKSETWCGLNTNPIYTWNSRFDPTSEI